MGKFTKDKRVLKTYLYSKKVLPLNLFCFYFFLRTSTTERPKKMVFVLVQHTNFFNSMRNSTFSQSARESSIYALLLVPGPK